jgi:hypothetical protein
MDFSHGQHYYNDISFSTSRNTAFEEENFGSDAERCLDPDKLQIHNRESGQR